MSRCIEQVGRRVDESSGWVGGGVGGRKLFSYLFTRAALLLHALQVLRTKARSIQRSLPSFSSSLFLLVCVTQLQELDACFSSSDLAWITLCFFKTRL